MPPWVAFVPRSTFLTKRSAIDRVAIRCRKVANIRPSNLRIRSASTHVSPTAINYRPNIPPKNAELYNTLSELSGAAEQYVNLSRLQLALRGLATEDAVTRIAVLGLNSQVSAQRLARLLLADPLGKEEGWEKELEKSGEGDKAVLLRFGDQTDAHPPSPLYKILSFPSKLLGTHNLEVLVSTLNVNVANTVTSLAAESSKDAVLVPKLQATSARGLPVPYPVHKTLILGDGLDSAIAYGRFASDSTSGDIGDMVKVAIDLPPPSKDIEPAGETASVPVNVDIGTKGLNALRTSVSNSTIYEHNWFASGLPKLSQWLVHNLQPSSPIKPAHKALISSILDDVEANITKADTEQLSKLASSTTQEQLGTEMTSYLESWAEKSHAELRDSLDEAFAGRNWRKLSWWKLFWRVDDAGMVLEEVLERRWLVSAEKDAVYLAGRMKQAGFPENVRYTTLEIPLDAQTTAATAQQTASDTAVDEPPKTDISTEVKQQIPWPSLIATTRTALLAETIPPLQALAQRLILTTLSTTSLSSALSALLYVSMPSISLFEASAVAALGLVLSLRRMQKSWEGAREMWQVRIREEGRQTLKRTEELVRLIIRGRKWGGGGDEDGGVEERRVAREAVRKVREALGKMEGE